MTTPLRLLLVEDSEEDALLLLRELRQRGYAPAHKRVDTAAAMTAALLEAEWDLVIADYRMPRFSGEEALRLLRGQGYDLPFIMVSGVLGEEAAVEAMRTGVDDYILKGNLARLAPAVARELRKNEERRRRRGAERNLRLSEARQSLLLRSVPAALYSAAMPPDLRRTWISRNVENLSGFSADRLLEADFWKSRIHPEDRATVLARLEDIPDKKRHVSLEYRWRCADNAYRWFLDRLTVLQDEAGRPLELAGTWLDITDRVRGEEYVKASLREKETLLKEIHHRVKNNLQIMQNLIDLQARRLKDPAALPGLQDCLGRVKALAMVHEKLHRSADLDSVNFADYARDLVQSLFQAYGADGKRIALRAEVQEIFLGMDEAVPCGLLLHELVSNSLKHAFPGGRTGQVWIGLSQADGRARLRVGDDGVGLPAGLDFRASGTVGLQLVSTLARQLGGDIRKKEGRGTEFEISFPLPGKGVRAFLPNSDS